MLEYRETETGIDILYAPTGQVVHSLFTGEYDPIDLQVPDHRLSAQLRSLAAGVVLPPSAKRLLLPFPGMIAREGRWAETKYIGVYCYQQNPIWNDGRENRTFSCQAFYRPWVSHPGVAFQLRGVELGESGNPPESLLIVDQITDAVYLADYIEGFEFLRSQWPPRFIYTEPDMATMADLADSLRGFADFQRLGIIAEHALDPQLLKVSQSIQRWLTARLKDWVDKEFLNSQSRMTMNSSSLEELQLLVDIVGEFLQ